MSTVNFTVTRNEKKYVLDQNGELSDAAINTPAFQYNNDGSYKGMIIEQERENVCLQSEDFNTTWSKSGDSIISASTEQTPDGDDTSKNIKLIDDNAGGTGFVWVSQSVTVNANGTYTGSIFIKADGLSYARLNAYDYDGSTDGYQYFELSGSGSMGTASNIDDSEIQAYPNGWYRCSITWTQGSNTTVTFLVHVADSISNVSVDRDNSSSIFIWGAEVKELDYASSYIPTTTTTVIQPADQISKSSASSYIGQTSGTIYAEIDIERLDTNRSIICVREDADPVVNRILLGVTSFNQFYYEIVGDDGDTEISFTTPVTTGIHKLIITYSSGDTRAYLNGVQIGSSSSSLSFGSTLDIIDIGDDGSDKEPNIFDESTEVFDTSEYYCNVSYFLELNSWIRCFALYKRALSDVEAQRLSLL